MMTQNKTTIEKIAIMTTTMKSTYENPFVSGLGCGNVFNNNLENFRPISMGDAVNKNVGDIAVFRRIIIISKTDKQVTEYMGKIVKSEKSVDTKPEYGLISHNTKYIMHIMYKREGYVYKSKRYIRFNPQWVRHNEYSYNAYTFKQWHGKDNYYMNVQFNSKRHFDFNSIKDQPFETIRKEYFQEKPRVFISDSIGPNVFRITKHQYFEPPLIGGVDVTRLVNENMSPNQAEETLKTLFNSVSYDIYRNIMDFI